MIAVVAALLVGVLHGLVPLAAGAALAHGLLAARAYAVRRRLLAARARDLRRGPVYRRLRP